MASSDADKKRDHDDDIQHLLNAYVDEQLPESECADLEERLLSDDAAQRDVEELRDLDSQLRTALAPFASTGEVTESILEEMPRPRRMPVPRSPQGWALTITGAAAGFLFALALFPLFQKAEMDPASGPTEIALVTRYEYGFNEIIWVPEPPKSKFRVEPGDAKKGRGTFHVHGRNAAALTMADGTPLYLGADTGIRVKGPRSIRLQDGNAWLQPASRLEEWRIELPLGELVLSGAEAVVYVGTQLTQVTVLNGEARYVGPSGDVELLGGTGLLITADGPQQPHQVYFVVKRLGWALELLALPEADPATRKWIVDQLIGDLSAPEIADFSESLLSTTFTPFASPYLIEMLERDFHATPAARRIAAAVLAQTTRNQLDAAYVEKLFELVLDDDREVRAPLIKTLEVASGTPAIRPERILDGEPQMRRDIVAKWRGVWEQTQLNPQRR